MNNKASLSGSLSFLGLADLMQLLGSNGSSGTLRVQSKYVSEAGVVYFANGNPIDAAAGKLKGIDALFALFGWTDGAFEFNQDSIERKKVITQSRMEIILDGLKKLDDGQIEKIGPESMIKAVSAGDGGPEVPLIKAPLIDYNYVVDEEECFDGSKIVEEGKHGNWIWVILEGVVDIIRETPSGQKITVVKVGTGSFIGSMASFLLEGHVRSASAVACGKVQLGVLDSQRIASEYAKMSAGFKGLFKMLGTRLMQVTDRVVDCHLNKDRLPEFIKNRNLVIKQGAKDAKAYMIDQGNAYLVRSADSLQIPLVKLGKEDYFGSFPFLDIGHEPFSAAVYGSEDLKFSEIDIKTLQKEYNQLSSTVKRIIENIAMNISVTTMLVSNMQKKTGR